MNYISTRGKAPVSAMTAVCRGLAEDGGLFVPQELPSPLDIRTLYGLSFEETSARFFHRFLPELPFETWRQITREALSSLAMGPEEFQFPVHRLNPYLDRYYLFNADGFPTGSLADLSASILKALWPRALELLDVRERPLLVGVVTEDQAIAFRHGLEAPPSLLYVPDKGLRGLELSLSKAARVFSDSFDDGYRALTSLASDSAFQAHFEEAGVFPLFVGPGHLIEALTAGAVAAQIMAAAGQELEEEAKVDFVVSKDHLSFFAGLVYAASLELPVGMVYVGENDPPSLSTLFSSGRLAFPKKNRRPDDPGAVWPVNLERLLFEVSGRDPARILDILRLAEEENGDWLSDEESHLLGQSVLVTSNDYKRSIRMIRTIYDQTDYLLARDTADAVAGWAKRSGKKSQAPVCFVQTRSPLFDAYTSGRAILGSKLPRGDYGAAVRLLAEEAGVPVGQPLEELLDGGDAAASEAIAATIGEDIREYLLRGESGEESERE